MQTATYYYHVNEKHFFALTQNNKKLRSPIDLQFYIEILIEKYNLYIQIMPCNTPNTIKGVFEMDDKYVYCAIESKLRKYIKEHYI